MRSKSTLSRFVCRLWYDTLDADARFRSLKESHQRRGRSNIEVELISPDNDRFVLHDSEGFEPGELKNFEIVENFIRARNRNDHIKDRIHAIWYAPHLHPTQRRALTTFSQALHSDPSSGRPCT